MKVNKWKNIEDIDIDRMIAEPGVGVQQACRVLNRMDLYKEFEGALEEARSTYPDWLEGGTEDEQEILEGWFYDVGEINNKIIKEVENKLLENE